MSQNPQPGQPAPSAPSGSGSASGSAPSQSAAAPTSSGLNIPASAAAGILSFTEPVQTVTSFYKIAPGALVTFGWKFSDVLATPTSLTVSAVCDNGNTYPVGPTDGIIPGTATQVIWDPYKYQTDNPNTPLAQANYNLKIWDDRGPDAQRRGGYLTPNTGLKFGMYFPQQYTGLSDGWSCPNCNNGSYSSYIAHPAFAALVATVLVVFLSGFSLIRQIRA